MRAFTDYAAITVSYRYDLNPLENAWLAAQALMSKNNMNWPYKFAAGEDENGYYFTPIYSYNTVEFEK